MALGRSRRYILDHVTSQHDLHERTVDRWMAEIRADWAESFAHRRDQLKQRAEALWTRAYYRAVKSEDNNLLAKATDALCRLWGVYEADKRKEIIDIDVSDEDKLAAVLEFAERAKLGP